MDDADTSILHDRPQQRNQAAVDLDGRDVRPGLGESQRQGSEACTDLDDRAPRTHSRKPGDAPDRVRVDHEVLPECPARMEAS